MDYLHGFGADKNLPPFGSGGVIDGDGNVNFGSTSDILEAESSMGFNYATFGVSNPGLFGKDTSSPAASSTYVVTDAALSAWVFDSIYELRVDESVFPTALTLRTPPRTRLRSYTIRLTRSARTRYSR